MTDVEKISELLFELSSSERIRILLKIKAEGQKLSQLSKDLKLTASETFRHLQRLSKMELIEKDKNAFYNLTPFGKVTVSLLPSLDFIVRNKRYLLDYDVSVIPQEFIERLGELQEGELGSDTMYNLRWTELMFQEAQEYVWFLSDQVLVSSQPIIEGRIEAGVEVRAIFPEKIVPPPGFQPLKARISTTKMYQERYLDKIQIIIALNEKAASFCLPDTHGRIFYHGFGSKDKRFHKWVRDLFLYHWEKAKAATA